MASATHVVDGAPVLADGGTPPEIAVGSVLEKSLIAIGLTIFCATGFFGIAHLNAAHAASGAPYWPLDTRLDSLMGFDPRWIWIYLSYYLGCFLPLISWRRGTMFRQVAAGYALEFGICFALFALVPARMAQPAVVGGGWNEWAVRELYRIDGGFNIFPSLHVSNTLFVAAACARFDRRLGFAAWIWAILVSISTMTVKQHYAVDVIAGGGVAALTIWLVMVRWDGLTSHERERSRLEPESFMTLAAPRMTS